MKPNLQRKLRTLAIICLFTSFAGVIFQLISEKLLNYKSVMVGFPLGLVFGIMELFLLPRAESKFRQ
jgi:adenylate cyclase